MSRASFYRWRSEDAAFAKQADEATLEGHLLVNDLAESQLIGAVKDRNLQAIMYWLKHHHKDYRNRLEIEGTLNTITELSDEQKALVKKLSNSRELNSNHMTNKNQNQNSDELFDAITKDPAVRRAVTRESHAMFFPIYLRHYIGYPMAEFQKDIIRTTEDQSNPLACIVAFRGSAKSTLVTLSYSIWAVLGVQAKKFVLIVCQTQAQARQHMMNLRRELEQNALLKSDLGPFKEEFGSGEWAMSSLVFKNTGARIMVASIDQSIRGVRHYQHRPDLIILDDIEDLNSTPDIGGSKQDLRLVHARNRAARRHRNAHCHGRQPFA